jgi:hypothetical protein
MNERIKALWRKGYLACACGWYGKGRHVVCPHCKLTLG